MNKLLNLLFVLGCVLASLQSAEAQFCQNGTANAGTCGCTCSDLTKYSFDGRDCYCDREKLRPPNLIFSWFNYDAANGCAATCPLGGTYFTWCRNTFNGAIWDASMCGCRCDAPKVVSGWTCACASVTDCAPQNKVWDGNSCQCVCPTSGPSTSLCQGLGKAYDANTCSCGGCLNLNMVPNGSGSCSCPTNPANSAQNSISCSWACNSGYIASGSSCVINTVNQ